MFKCNCGQTEGTNIVHACSLWEVFGQLQKLSCLFISVGTSHTASERERPGKLKALEDLDALGKSLLQQSLPSSCKVGSQFSVYVYHHLYYCVCILQCFLSGPQFYPNPCLKLECVINIY
jgi:hypothetical protein